MDENKKEFEIDLFELFQHFWKHKLLILILAVACATAMFVRTEFFVDDTYTASGVLYIRSDVSTEEENTGISNSDITTARNLTTTYIETLRLRSFLQDVAKDPAVLEKTKVLYSDTQIRRMLSVVTVNETEYLRISVTGTDPNAVQAIAKCICDKADDKFKDTFKGGEAVIVDEVPKVEELSANSKGVVRNTLIGAIIGMVIAVAFLFIRKMLDRRLHRSEEIKTRYDISILGETAQILEEGKKPKNKTSTDADNVKRVINSQTDFDTIETYKSIRTNIMFSIPKQEGGKVILLTSAAPGEGKTTTSVNTAITFAQMGAKVILLDCDLRKARVHRYLQIKRDNGISNLICGYIELAKAIKQNVRQNLDVLTAGDIPPNPAELLETEQFGKLIGVLREHYDYIILDTPPITVVTDAAIVTKHCDGVVLVTREGNTSHDLLSIAVNELKKADATIFGAIVHDCSEKRKKYYYQGNHKYSYKYSYKYKYNYHYGDEPTMKTDRAQKVKK